MNNQPTEGWKWGLGFPFLPSSDVPEKVVENTDSDEKETELEEKPKRAPVRMTAPHGSPAFTMTDHITCLSGTERRAFQEGSFALPAACVDGHPRSPTPQERGLIS